VSYVYSVVHAIIACEDCGWTARHYKNAQATAKIHAKRYGHRVSGDLGIYLVYDYRDVGGESEEEGKR